MTKYLVRFPINYNETDRTADYFIYKEVEGRKFWDLGALVNVWGYVVTFDNESGTKRTFKLYIKPMSTNSALYKQIWNQLNS